MKKQMLTPRCGALLLLCGAMLMFTENRAFAQAPHSSNVTIHVRDYCDPTSFNVAIGDGTCVRDTSLGAITFPGFVAELTTDQSAGAWRFAPDQISVSEGATLHVVNLGGETHTFTQVKDFGGGFIGFLNDISGNPVLAPECAQVVNGNLVPQPPGPDNIFLSPGGSITVPLDHEVNAKYQCCIHPWMRLTITPRDLHHTQVR